MNLKADRAVPKPLLGRHVPGNISDREIEATLQRIVIFSENPARLRVFRVCLVTSWDTC